ncbi:MAG: response regulator [Bacteroidales bacterium]|nr:response regulator [Bacteroidales bacterium]
MDNQLCKILIIDDSITNLQVVGKILEKDNFQVILAESGEAALKIIENKEIPDVILLDIMMPEMDGFAFKRILNENADWVKIPVIVISALHEQDDKSIAFGLGCVDYMVKPFNKDEIVNRVHVQIKIKEQQKQLIAINQELKEANLARDKIFSIISHDLRTSIGNIRNVFQFMIDGLIDPDEDKDLILDAEITSRNTYNLLDNLLYWAKSQQGQIVYKPELVNVLRVINGVAEMEKGSMLSKQIEYIESVDSDLFVWSDKVLFTIIVRNLLVNAIKFTPSAGRISIVSNAKDGKVKLSVIDSGVGIDEESIDKIMKNEVFTTTGTNNEKGTGLGLVLVKDCIQKSNGTFNLKSKVGQGSEFVIQLPGEKE